MASDEFDGVNVETLDMGEYLRGLIARRIEIHERSLQTVIGASELGTPCIRKLGHKLNQTPPVPDQVDGDDKWRPTVGTAVHEWLATMLRADNARLAQEAPSGIAHCDVHPWCVGETCHRDRWLVEYSTPIGTIGEDKVPGNLDVFDRFTGTMVDWKIVGPTALKSYKRDRHPGQQYRVQVQLYGRGLHRAGGEDVKYVGIMFLPSNGELKDHFYWEEEYDPEVGKDALARAREVKNLIDTEGPSILGKLKTTDDHCAHCPFFSPGATDLERECPGDPSLTANMDEGFADILPPGVR
jgi:hypothetical protein